MMLEHTKVLYAYVTWEVPRHSVHNKAVEIHPVVLPVRNVWLNLQESRFCGQ